MQHTSCTEDRIQHALNMCLDGLRQRSAPAGSWNGKLSFPVVPAVSASRANLPPPRLLILGMKKTVAFTELTPPPTASEADGAEPTAAVSPQLQPAAASGA